MDKPINPWSSQQSLDIDKLFTEFGIEPISTVIDQLPDAPDFIRRGVVVGHRDYQHIVAAIRNHMPFHVLTGLCPRAPRTSGT